MEIICPVCGHRMKGPKYEVGSKATCSVCRTRFEARAIVDYDKLEARESKKEFVIIQVLPLCALIFVICCGVGANFIHSQQSSTVEKQQPDASQSAAIASASPSPASEIPPTAEEDNQSPPQETQHSETTIAASPGGAAAMPSNAESDGRLPGSIGEVNEGFGGFAGAEMAAAEKARNAAKEDARAMASGGIRGGGMGFGGSPEKDIATTSTTGGSVIRLKTVATEFITSPAPEKHDEFRSTEWAATMPEPVSSIIFDTAINTAVTQRNSEIYRTDLRTGASEELFSTSERITSGATSRKTLTWATESGERFYWSGTGEPTQLNTSHSDVVTGAAIDPSSRYLTTCSLDGTVLQTLLGTSSPATRMTLPAPALSFCKTRSMMAIGCADRSVLLSKSVQGGFDRGFRASTPARFLALNESYTYIAVSGGKRLEVRDLRTFELCQLWEDLSSEASALALSLHGDLIAVGHLDGSLKIFSVADRKEVRTEKLTAPVTTLQFSSSDKLGVATANGELIPIELDEDLKSLPAESTHHRILRFARKEHAAAYTEADMKIDAKLKKAARDTPSRIQKMLSRVPQFPVGVSYVLKTGSRSGQVTAVGHGFKNVTGVNILRGGERPMSVKFNVLSDAKLEFRLSSRSAESPLIGLEFEGGYVVTIPMSIQGASKATLNSDQDDEILYLFSTYDTLDDEFQLLVMLEGGCIKEDITGSGLIVATDSAVLPESLHGEIALISTSKHKAPSRDSKSSAPNIVVDSVYVCPIPPLIAN